jgi:hypothetical protein
MIRPVFHRCGQTDKFIISNTGRKHISDPQPPCGQSSGLVKNQSVGFTGAGSFTAQA